ncbi:alpha/beta hydrolase fold protein [Streptomyces bingchenggensis BCW-1]|uniref:Alpha/beta hydrolase fold protein n=1 Tax=Streptomyces bingchenggensis (strain BCW-1) TaxID=749414 RepID=D7C9Z9_STRBB|nr:MULTISPECIES: alpha/beta hydrolase [Streptomyces]ADI04327.1 alpha/beta hydrolase fold protein [Streptomyces bingchenggensis BCW-1]
MGHDIRGYLEYFFERWTYNRHGLTPEAVDGYVRAFSRPGAMRASFDDYRAMEQDIALDDIDAAEGRRLTMPVLAVWGSAGLPARLLTLEIWRAYADDVTGAEIPECGHFIPEEQPEALLVHLRAFLAGGTNQWPRHGDGIGAPPVMRALADQSSRPTGLDHGVMSPYG